MQTLKPSSGYPRLAAHSAPCLHLAHHRPPPVGYNRRDRTRRARRTLFGILPKRDVGCASALRRHFGCAVGGTFERSAPSLKDSASALAAARLSVFFVFETVSRKNVLRFFHPFRRGGEGGVVVVLTTSRLDVACVSVLRGGDGSFTFTRRRLIFYLPPTSDTLSAAPGTTRF